MCAHAHVPAHTHVCVHTHALTCRHTAPTLTHSRVCKCKTHQSPYAHLHAGTLMCVQMEHTHVSLYTLMCARTHVSLCTFLSVRTVCKCHAPTCPVHISTCARSRVKMPHAYVSLCIFPCVHTRVRRQHTSTCPPCTRAYAHSRVQVPHARVSLCTFTCTCTLTCVHCHAGPTAVVTGCQGQGPPTHPDERHETALASVEHTGAGVAFAGTAEPPEARPRRQDTLPVGG